jgi:hypothetical protein
MATQAISDNLATKAGQIDKSGWTELQRIQFMLGMWDGVPGSQVKYREPPEWTWVPNEEWRKGEGLLSDRPDHDTTEMKRADLEWEEEHDARKFGYSRKL